MKKYPKYKDSGVSWIGEIPEHWETPKINKLFSIKAGGDAKPDLYTEEKDESHPYPVYTNADSPEAVYGYTSDPYYPKDSITVTGRGAIGHAIYRNDSPYDAIIRLLVLQKKGDYICKYFSYFIDTVIPFYSDSAAIAQLSAVQLAKYYALLPSKEEQLAIISYLDRKTSRIDKFIGEAEKEIDLLNELKQAQIARLVTHGLNPNVPTKDSGIAWTGEIPEHWDVKRIAMLFSENKTKNTDYEFDHAMKFNYGRLIPKEEKGDVTDLKDTYVAYTKIRKNDIAINCLNLNYDFVSQRVAIATEDGILTSAYLIISPRDGVNADYYNYFFKAMDNKKLFHGMGTGIRLTLSYTELKKQYVVVPPVEEQAAIVSAIETLNTKIDTLTAQLSNQIEHLKELKQRIISDAVTGKIDVRN